MTEEVAKELRAILEEYRSQVTSGGHPKELPERVLALVHDFPGGQPMPKDLEQLYVAALRYWNVFDHLPEGEREPDPLDLEMVCDELIDAFYGFYELR